MEDMGFNQGEYRPYNPVPIQEPKKKGRIPGICLAVLGALMLIIGIVVMATGSNISSMEQGVPEDVYFATETDQYVYAYVQFMTDSIASYEAMENMQFYIVLDSEFAPAVICMHTDELATYQPYIDWTYNESEENEPEEMQVVGYAQPYDAELKQYVIECFGEIFGEDIVDETNFEEYFGEYYLQTGQKNEAYGFSNMGIVLVLVGLVVLVIGGVMAYEKPVPQTVYGYGGFTMVQGNIVLGIVGALIGAMLGGLLWTFIGVLGFVSSWIGMLIVYFSYTGYKVLGKREDVAGLVISLVCSLIIILPATYLVWGWSYYQVLNESISGYTTLSRALTELPTFMEAADCWGEFAKDVGMGYLFMFIAVVYSFSGLVKNK